MARSKCWRAGPMVPLLLIAAISGWAMSAADPDFPLPDPFHVIALAVALGALIALLLPWARVRNGVVLVIALPVVSILVLEANRRFRAPSSTATRAMRTEDRLLRYQYRPFGPTGEADPAAPQQINHLGLFDHEYAIPKPPGVYRVAVLSGSVANDGYVPYASRFHALLETRLQSSPPDARRVEVLNVSCEGYNTLQDVRLLELVGMAYEPDLVVVAHMLTSATFQDGSGRRFGNAYFAGALLPVASRVMHGSICAMVAPFYEGYSFEVVTRAGFDRLAADARNGGFEAIVAVLPAVERFDDPTCLGIYGKVADTARAAGLGAVSVVDSFKGEDFLRFAKPNASWDFCHPNAAGHARYAEAIEAAVREAMTRPRPRP